MSTVTCKALSSFMPLECAGMFFIPEHSSKSGITGMPRNRPAGLVPRGFSPSAKSPTFQNIPVALECQKNYAAQQPRGFQPCRVFDIPDIPDVLGVNPPFFFSGPAHASDFH
ncbi:hypothetical protein [Stutzerimonas stutzeri]|uniref:Uncharacterized protein n=1 Tax=Stutzerimonas stutzeri TaxID=316 RepID=A0AA40V408_STUST|nr:hypothetical protein [Stutzerimonas stutzeri]MBA1302830.1 hypothetical protein [Stutzerimonas stutzeri]